MGISPASLTNGPAGRPAGTAAPSCYLHSELSSIDGNVPGPASWTDQPVCLLEDVPRPPLPEAGRPAGDPGRELRLAALISAYHAGVDDGEAILFGWRRQRPEGPVQVWIGGPTLIGGSDGRVSLNYPPGARGRPVPLAELAAGWREVGAWAHLTAIPDVLSLRDQDQAELLRPSLEDSLLGVWHEPFCWMIEARPVSLREIEAMTTQISHQLRLARSQMATSPDQAIEAERLQARHRELSQAESTGLWSCRVLCGGDDARSARRLAGLLSGSIDLGRLPYVLRPSRAAASLDDALGDTGTAFSASSQFLSAVARPPAEEIPGIRLSLRPRFDVTPEEPPADQPHLELGQVLDRNGAPAGPFLLPFSSLNRHTFVCGATGAGKSQTVRSLLQELSRRGIPWLVVEPAKAEYRLMAARLEGTQPVITIRPGAPDGLPASINPLEPEPGFPLQTHADLVRALFLAAFEAEEPFPQVLSAALTQCYEDAGWDMTVSEARDGHGRPGFPTLNDLQRVARNVVERIGYGPEVTQNVRGFIEVRLSSLRLGTTGRFFEGGHPIDFSRLLSGNVVMEIEDVGDDRDKAFLMGTVLVRLVEHLRVRERLQGGGEPQRLRHVSVFEEAHRLLRRSDTPGAAAHAVELFAGLLAEIRAYGEGLVVAEQIPSKLLQDVIKNTAVKIVHRLPAQDDREAVGATMNVTRDQSDYLVTLRPGFCAAYTDGMDYPLLVRMPDRTGSEAAPAETQNAASIVQAAHPACGPACRDRPCSLREMRAAQHLIDDERGPAIWTEAAVVAHLVGMPTPAPGPDLRAMLVALEDHGRECLIRTGVEAAVAARAAALGVSGVDVDGLAAHVAGVLRAQLAEGGRPCPPLEFPWMAASYRWYPVMRALRRTFDRGLEPWHRHPASATWERAYGRAIPGRDCWQQVVAVEGWLHSDRADAGLRRELLLGTGGGSAIEQRLRAGPDGGNGTPRRIRIRNDLEGGLGWLETLLRALDMDQLGKGQAAHRPPPHTH
jgi:DNA helicase HerA-like ATPase